MIETLINIGAFLIGLKFVLFFGFIAVYLAWAFVYTIYKKISGN